MMTVSVALLLPSFTVRVNVSVAARLGAVKVVVAALGVFRGTLTLEGSLSVTLNTPKAATATFTAPNRAATLTFTLTVTDGNDNQVTDTVTITVEDQNPPTAEAGAPRTVGPGSVRLQGSGTDAEGAVTYSWAFTSSTPPGTDISLTGGDTASPTFTAPNTAVALTFSLIVTDEAGNASTADTVVITVDPNLPNVNAGDDVTVGPGIQVTLNGSGPPTRADSVTYEWSWAAECTFEPSHPELAKTTATPTFTSPSTTGTYTLTLTVTDTVTSTTASDSVTIIVDANAPTAEAGDPQTVNVGADVTLDGTASTDREDANTLTYAWDLTASDPSGALIDLTNATSAEPTFTAPNSPVVLTFTLTVTDGGNNEATDTVIITVADGNAPTANAGDDQTVAGKCLRSPWTAPLPPIMRE